MYMIAEVQFESPLLEETAREVSAGGVAIEHLDSAEGTPLRAVCWLADGDAEAFEVGVDADPTVADATHVVDTPQGHQYQVTCRKRFPGTDLYDVVVETDGILLSGSRHVDIWELELRFPDRDAFGAFRDACDRTAVDPGVQAIHDQDGMARAAQYGVSEPQREILLLAARAGYFDVPRQASLADLAVELDISSQAASERLRRGLDSLVERALLTPE
jgi:predicted DNA binding protein